MHFRYTGTSISHGLAAFVHSLLDIFSHYYYVYFNHEYDATINSIHKGFDLHEQVIASQAHHVYKVEQI
jgi:hypothetical protein